MKKKILALMLALSAISGTISVSAVSSSSRYVGKNPIAAGDVCGLISKHHCEFCEDSVMLLADESCPRCGSSLQSVCSGDYAVNPETGSTYFYVNCYVGSHPDGCQTIQSRCYTDTKCVSCNYHVSGTTTHIQAYFHSLEPS
ncbi:MAG: hypothetical protein ACI4T6_06165, partial [Candidatus Flemingiibacterium sp.]